MGLKCDKCGADMKEIKRIERRIYMGNEVVSEYDEITYKCPKCGIYMYDHEHGGEKSGKRGKISKKGRGRKD